MDNTPTVSTSTGATGMAFPTNGSNLNLEEMSLLQLFSEGFVQDKTSVYISNAIVGDVNKEELVSNNRHNAMTMLILPIF